MRILLFITSVCFAIPACAGDWPQILGPTRNGIANDEQLVAWPKDGLKIAWKQAVGEGYAGPAIADGKVVLFHRVKDIERVAAFDLVSGKPLWKADFEATYRGGIDADTGPRCVPLIADGRVYAFGAGADLHCVSLAKGEKVWSRALAADFDMNENELGYFGAGSSPILAGGKLWLNLGSRAAGIVALDPANGKTLYEGTTEQASYSSPTQGKFGGADSLIFITRLNCLGLDPKTGAQQFSFPFGKRGPTVNAATPLVIEDRLFVTASYDIGARMMRLAKPEPKAVWENDHMASQYATCVYHDGYLYGSDGREDIGVATLRCLDAQTGEVQWSEEGYGVAHLILVGDQLLIVRNNGGLAVAPATPAGYKPSATAALTKGTLRALPALSRGRLVARTTSGELLCAEVGKP